MGAVLSTGDETWEVKVMGYLPENNTWTNIAIRWENLKFRDQNSFEAAAQEYNNDITRLGGLQLLMNMEVIGHSLLPEERDCACTITDCDQSNETMIECKDGVQAQDPLDQPTMMLGCHKTNNTPTYRDFAGGTFDEVAFWNKRIPDEKKHMFLGGWSKLQIEFPISLTILFSEETYDNVDSPELLNIMDRVDFSDPVSYTHLTLPTILLV